MSLASLVKKALNKRKNLDIEFDELSAKNEALDKVLGVIEFTPDGYILNANANFLAVVGYPLDAIVGKHHSMFVDPGFANSNEYKDMWKRLVGGMFERGQYRRLNAEGEVVWLEASYNPIKDKLGKVRKVVKFATDITSAKLKEFNYVGQMNAINKTLGVIEFDLKGNILNVNENFANVVGYPIEFIVGKHHSMFADEKLKGSPEYKIFWENLVKGEPNSGVFKRVGNGGREIWLQANYNPVFDNDGKPFKVVKYATEITSQKLEQADFSGKMTAISKMMAVIEFDLQGNILAANDNFLKVVGYSLSEVVGKHHSMFVSQNDKNSSEYKNFWKMLAEGKSQEGVFKRVSKSGKDIVLQASYGPIYDVDGNPIKVVKFATDITMQSIRDTDNAGQLTSINRSLACIEFNMQGIITKVNKNFADVVGYQESELIGQHHSMFVDGDYKKSNDYKAFWERLNRGEFDIGIYRRLGKGGKEIWLQASYNPIVGPDGAPVKVVKFATDISERYKEDQMFKAAVSETDLVIQSAKKGDLTQRIPLEGKKNDILTLCNGVNELLENVEEMVAKMRYSGEAINTASNEISTGNNDLSRRTEQQAAQLEKTASSIEQLSATVKQNADNARQANQLAEAASDVASKGGQVIGDVIDTMGEINESAHKIQDIISVIDGIAFQTNILALNAAVEAARAGEQGRGFAVVAGEVRNLAQRSASAAKEIKELISTSMSKVQVGTKLVEDAGTTMNEIVNSVHRVTDIMGEIDAASQEQSTGLALIGEAVSSLDEVTQQNAALVEEAAAASESLVEQANGLVETVGMYKTSTGELGSMKGSSIKPMSKVAKVATASPRLSQSKVDLSKKVSGSDVDWEEF